MGIIVGGKVAFAEVRGPSSLNLGDLGDVTIASPVQGNFLAYNATTSDWENRNILASDLPASGVTANTYGSSTTVPVLTVDSTGRITVASTVAISSQPLDATLTGIAAVNATADTVIYATGTDVFATTGLTAFGRSLIDDANATAARTTLGLGNMATQDTSSFQPADATLTALAGVTTIANTIIVATNTDAFTTAPVTTYGLSLIDDADATAARTTLGLGTAATTAASAYQPADATLTALAGVTSAANTLIYATGPDAFSTTSVTAFGRSLIDDADAAAGRTTLGLGTAATTDASAYQPVDATLTALAGVTTAADQILYSTASDAFTTTGLTAFGRSLIDDADATAARTTLGLGTAATTAASAYQPADATLTALAGVTTSANTMQYFTGVDVAASAPLTAFGRSLIDDTDAATARTTLGLGTAATTDASAYQPVDATLSGLSGTITAANTLIYATGVDTFATVPVTAFGLSLLDDANAAAARTSLGITSSGTTASSSANVVDTLVLRDNLGNFSAGVITASLTGVASDATKLATARTINGVSFDGTADITVADATKLPLTGGTITGSLSISQNLSVGGTITGVQRTVSTGDNAILLNSDLVTGVAAQSGGFYVWQGPDNSNNAQGLVWDQAAGQWEVQSRTGVIPPPGGTGDINVGTETAAFKIWHAGNDGTGSGLDADLLDGQNGSFYQDATNLTTGTLPIATLPAFTGDITSAAGSNVNTLVSTGVVANTYGAATTVPVLSVDAKGRITNATTATIPAASTTASGIVELATNAETTAGTDAARAVTPAGLAAVTTTLQPKDATLTALAGVTTAADQLIYATAADTFAVTGLTAFGRSLIDEVDAAAARSTLGLGTAATTASTAYQPVDATLTALAGVTTAANTMQYFTGIDVAASTPLTAFGRSLMDDADAATARTTLGLGTAATTASTAYQPVDATLTALAGVTTAADQLIYATAADTFATTSLTAFGRSLIEDADAATARTTLGLGTMSTQNANAVALTGTPTAPTAAAATNTTQIATTAYVQTEKANLNASNLTSGTVPDARISGSYTGLTNLTGTGTATFTKYIGNVADTVTTPSFTWSGDTTTGMYRSAASTIAFACAGVQQATISSTGIAGVGTNLTALNGTNITTGTIAAARVATLNQNTTGSSGSCTGNALTATTLQTARAINGVSFNGSADITVADATKLPLAGGSLTGAVTSTGTIVTTNTTASTSATTGALRSSGGLGVAGDIYAGGNVTGYSDIRLKTDLELIPDALNKVCSLRGLTYTRTDSGQRQTGLIAQEVQKVLPEAVSGDDILGVAYGNMMGLMVEAIKELTAKIANQDKIIHDLLQRIQ